MKYSINKPLKYITLTLVLFWMAIIAFFSSQHGEASGSLSGSIAARIVTMEQWITGRTYTNQEFQDRIDAWQFPVRKSAHVSVFFVLGILVSIHLRFYSMTEKKRFLTALLIVVLYACFDELHQYFIPGRVASIKDVGFDTVGGFLGIGLVSLITRRIHKYPSSELLNEE